MNTSFVSKTLAPAASKMASPLESWLYGLLNAVIIGGSTAVVSALGLATAHGMGVADIPQVNWHTIEVVFVSGAASKFFIYCAQGLPVLQRNDAEGAAIDAQSAISSSINKIDNQNP